ncbi:fluoride efflux transporter CrcB [Pseudothermotoga sp. U03pept]|uniref:fluoride efflux transporter CrcB n=1 Tax=Pseudothermotoga sp. U03pept TaxID=3447012 RepID=UPI003F064487
MSSSNLMKILAVGFGGFLGSVARYLISLWLSEKYPNSYVPYGTLVANVLGSFLLGVVMEIATYVPMSVSKRLLLTTGIMGGLTTFSTLSYETMALFYSGVYSAAVLNEAINVVLGLAGAFGGKKLVDLIIRV